MKIVQAHKFYFMKGGAERYMLDVSHWLKDAGHEVIPFAMQHSDNVETPYSSFFPRFVQTQSVKSPWQGMRTLNRMMFGNDSRRAFGKLLMYTKPDLCHVHSIYNQLSPSILSELKKRRIPTVMTVHDHHLVSPQYNIAADGCGDDLRDVGLCRATVKKFHQNSYLKSLIQAGVFKWHYYRQVYKKNVDLFITPSQYLKRQLIRGGFDAAQIRVNAYGIDPRSIEPRFDHDKYFLFVGRLSEEKGVDTLVHLAKLLPDIRFKIVGRGPEMNRLHALGHGLSNLEFMGFRAGDELREIYRGATAVMLPSRVHENFPLISLEAMAAGKPLIASEVGGVPEVVEDRVTGFLVKPTDLNGWTEAVMRIAYDDDLADRMSRAARERVETKFQLRDHFRRLMAIYEEVTPIHVS